MRTSTGSGQESFLAHHVAAADDDANAAGPTTFDGGDVGHVVPCRSWLVDRRVLASSGDQVGISVEAYAEGVTGVAKWLAVYTGRRDAVIVIVPVNGSSLLGDNVIIAHDLDTVLAAPGHPSTLPDPTREELLSAHYRRRACQAAHPSHASAPMRARWWLDRTCPGADAALRARDRPT